jgi:hypothetical protein
MSAVAETTTSSVPGAEKMEAAGMSQEQMEAWAKLAAPGPAHQVLLAMVGQFKADVTFFMGPNEQKSTGVMRNSLVLGGRYLENRYQGDAGDMAGIGFVGFDNAKQKYTGLWMDTMSTMIMVSQGTIDASGKVITMEATVDCPSHGGPQLSRNVTTIVDNDRHTYEMYMPGPDGQQHKCLHIVYTRVK